MFIMSSVVTLEKTIFRFIGQKFINQELNYKREWVIDNSGNIINFIVEDKIILEIKAKQIIEKGDYYQFERYLQPANKLLGLLVNSRCRY